MARTASADSLGVGQRQTPLTGHRSPLGDLGASTFHKARGAGQGTTGDPRLRPSPLPGPTPRISFLWETLVKPRAPWSSPGAKNRQVSRPRIFQQSFPQATAGRVCSQSIQEYYTDRRILLTEPLTSALPQVEVGNVSNSICVSLTHAWASLVAQR